MLAPLGDSALAGAEADDGPLQIV